MLSVLRKQAQSTLIQGLVVLIAVVFIFWGVGSNMNNNRNTVATVNGKEITFQDYQRAYDQAVDKLQRQFGGQVPPGLLKGMGLKHQVVGQLVQAELLRQGGEKMGVVVSDFAVQHEVEKMSAFQENGHFNLDRYKAILRRNRMTPTGFELGIKADLQRQRVVDAVGGFAGIPENMLQDWYAFTNEEIKLAYFIVKPEDYEKKVVIDDTELATWFEKNREKYKSDPEVKLSYLLFRYDTDSQDVQVSDEELRQRYESELDSFHRPEQRHARHILIKVAETADDATKAAQKKKAMEVLAKAKQGKDFATLASQFSEGPTRENGGDLGFFSKGQMVPAFDEAVFSMQPGDISNLVKTKFGYHIIKLEEIRPELTRSFEQVKDSLAASIKKEKARSLTFKRASKAYEDIMRAGSLDKYSQSGVEKVFKTEFFTRKAPPALLAKKNKFLNEAFALKKGELSSLVDLDTGYAIIFVSDIKEPALPVLQEVRERAVADYTHEMSVKLAAGAAEELLSRARQQGDLAKVAGKNSIVQTPLLQRTSSAGKDALPPLVLADGFKLPWKDKIPAKAVKVGTDFYLYQVIDRRPGQEEADAVKREKVRKQLQQFRRNELVATWLSRVQEQSKLWTNKTLLQ